MLAHALEQGLRPGAVVALELLATLALDAESFAEAARLYAAAQAARDAMGYVRYPVDRPAYEADLTRTREELGDEAFDGAWSEDVALSLEEAAGYATRGRGERKRPSTGDRSRRPSSTWFALSLRVSPTRRSPSGCSSREGQCAGIYCTSSPN